MTEPEPVASAWDSMVLVGRIVRPHGIRGQVVVIPETDFGSSRFQPGATLSTQRAGQVETLSVATSRTHDGRWVIGFEGTATMNEAETLRGLELRIPAEAIQPLDPGAYYLHDLVGCRVETTSGTTVGPVARVDRDAGTPLLVVAGPEGEVLVPLAETICRKVDIEAKVIVIEPLKGLLELNQ